MEIEFYGYAPGFSPGRSGRQGSEQALEGYGNLNIEDSRDLLFALCTDTIQCHANDDGYELFFASYHNGGSGKRDFPVNLALSLHKDSAWAQEICDRPEKLFELHGKLKKCTVEEFNSMAFESEEPFRSLFGRPQKHNRQINEASPQFLAAFLESVLFPDEKKVFFLSLEARDGKKRVELFDKKMQRVIGDSLRRLPREIRRRCSFLINPEKFTGGVKVPIVIHQGKMPKLRLNGYARPVEVHDLSSFSEETQILTKTFMSMKNDQLKKLDKMTPEEILERFIGMNSTEKDAKNTGEVPNRGKRNRFWRRMHERPTFGRRKKANGSKNNGGKRCAKLLLILAVLYLSLRSMEPDVQTVAGTIDYFFELYENFSWAVIGSSLTYLWMAYSYSKDKVPWEDVHDQSEASFTQAASHWEGDDDI